MKNKHTPRPWTWSETPEGELILEHAPSNVIIARFESRCWPTPANRAVLALAPAMLERLTARVASCCPQPDKAECIDCAADRAILRAVEEG